MDDVACGKINYWESVFQENPNYYSDLENPSRKAILDYLGHKDTILDLGCGVGAFRGLLDDSRGYLGLDYSPTAIKLACERYSKSKFMMGDSRNLSLFKDNEYDVVVMRHFLENQEDWRKIVKESFRIANKKVIIVIRRPFINEPSKILENPDDTWVWDINWNEFNQLSRELSVNVSYGKVNEEEIVIIGKHLDEVVFELDDFHDTNHNLPLILSLKDRFPKLKITLFCILSQCSLKFLQNIKDRYGNWISLGLHGDKHDTEHGTAREVDFWSEQEMNEYLDKVETWGVFDKVFRAPGWNYNTNCYKVLMERGYIAAEHLGHDRWEKEYPMKRYTTGHLMEVHGHVANINMNGLEELATTKCNFSKDTEFYFVKDAPLGMENYLPNRYQ